MNENTEGSIRRREVEQLGVQGVDPLDEKDVVRRKPQRRSPFALAGAEVKVIARGAHGLTREQPRHLIAQKREVESFEHLEVVCAARIAWRSVAIEIVIIERKLDGSNSVDEKLNFQSFDEGRLPRR